MSRPVRIGNAQGFWGDRTDAAAEMLAIEPDIDFLTLDFLAEVSMSILAVQRSRDPEAGWPRDLLDVVRAIAPYWRGGGRCRVITNAGGLSPLGCARACRAALQEAGCGDRTIAVVTGDDVLEHVRAGDAEDGLLRNLDTGRPITDVQDRLLTANAYLGARPLAAALHSGADLIIAGRVADPSLTLAAAADWFGWAWDDWDRLAGGTIAGHLIECGTQVTGGIATDWLQTPEVDHIGFPIVDINADGSCVVTKPRGSGGRVCRQTVKEQLVYEIGDPDAYLSPDVTVSMLSVQIDDDGNDRIRVRGARGRPAPTAYKVSATYPDGFWAEGRLTIFGSDAVPKARRAGRALLSRLQSGGVSLRESVVECLGAGACRPQGMDPALASQLHETVLRIAVADSSREAIERFARELMPLVTAGPPGTTGYAEGRPRVHPLFRFWPCLIARERVNPQIETLTVADGESGGGGEWRSGKDKETSRQGDQETPLSTMDPPSPSLPASVPPPLPSPLSRRLGDIAHGRSGDKGIHANIGLLARGPGDFPRLVREATAQRVAEYLGIADPARVTRYELPNLEALNFIVRGVLACPLRVDAQGKALAQVLLDMPLGEVE